MIHIDTIYETEAFRLLHQGMKDKHAVAVVYTLMACNEEVSREFERWCAAELAEQDDDRAEWEARLMEEVQKQLDDAQKKMAEERAVWEAERSKQYIIGDVTNELVFKKHGVNNLSDLQKVFKLVEAEFSGLTDRLANETRWHEKNKAELLRVTSENKATIILLNGYLDDLRVELRKIQQACELAGYANLESPVTVIGCLAAQIDTRNKQITDLKIELANSDTVSSRNYLARMDVVHNRLFGDDPTDLKERRDRHAEECLELLQALRMPKHELYKLIDYVWNRRPGNAEDEIADSFTTLVSLGIQMDLNVFNLGLRGLKRLERDEVIDKVRAKRKTRHGRGPLPGLDPKRPQVGTLSAGESTGESWAKAGDTDTKEPQTIGEVMQSRDFSTGEPKRSIIGDNDGPWELSAAGKSNALHSQSIGRSVRPVHTARGIDVLVQSTADMPLATQAGEVTIVQPPGFRWGMGQLLRKKRGSEWHGRVSGFYIGKHTPEGYVVQSIYEPGNNQVYPVAALEEWDGK